MLDYSRLTAPAEEGGVLVEPPGAGLGTAAQRNVAERDSDAWRHFKLCGQDGGLLRAELRARLGLPADRAVIATGHQPEFYHAGVWAKGVVCSALAQRLGATAVQLIVDHDKIRARALAVPVVRDARVKVASVTLPGFQTATVYEHLPAWSSSDIGRLAAAVQDAAAGAGQSGLLSEWLAALGSAPRGGTWVRQFASALDRIDEYWGVRLQPLFASELGLEPFFAELIAGARRFCACYNDALAWYRALNGIKGTRHPIPNLAWDAERVELPLWVTRRGGNKRQRLHVADRGPRLTLLAGSTAMASFDRGSFEQLPSAVAALRHLADTWMLRPRALTLTLWARTLLSDLFIHGIGGAKYDRITDRILRDYFDVSPPRLAVVSATARLPLPRYGVAAADRRAAFLRLRDLRYNPQRVVGGDPHSAALLGEKQELVAASERLRREVPGDHASRAAVFRRIREINRALQASCGDVLETVRRRLSELQWQQRSDAAAASREYFYCLLPRQCLQAVRDNLLAGL